MLFNFYVAFVAIVCVLTLSSCAIPLSWWAEEAEEVFEEIIEEEKEIHPHGETRKTRCHIEKKKTKNDETV